MKALEAASAWWLHNDARVSEMSERAVLEECETAGYLLFYVFSSVATSAVPAAWKPPPPRFSRLCIRHATTTMLKPCCFIVWMARGGGGQHAPTISQSSLHQAGQVAVLQLLVRTLHALQLCLLACAVESA